MWQHYKTIPTITAIYYGILTLEKIRLKLLRYITVVSLYNIGPWGQCCKTLIYCDSRVIPSFCVINLYYLGNYLGMAVNYQGIKLFYNIGQKCLLSVSNLKYYVIFCGNLPQYSNPRNSRV